MLLPFLAVGPVAAAAVSGDDSYGATAPLILEDQPFTIAAPGVLANDHAGPGETLCIVQAPTTSAQGGTVSLNGDGSFTYTPAGDDSGPDSFTYGVAGIAGACPATPATPDATATVSLSVTAVNDAPAVEAVGDCADGVSVPEDSGAYSSGPCLAFHPGPADEGTQGFAAWDIEIGSTVGFASGPTISDAGVLQFRPAADDAGAATLTIRARDDGGTANGGVDTSPAIELTISIAPVPDAPTAASDAFGALRDRTLNIAAPGVLGNDRDGDGDALTAVLVTGPIHGVLTLAANGSFSYTPATGYVGADAFSYRASDGGLTSTTRIVSLSVSAIPTPTPTPLVTAAPASEAPSAEPTVEVTAEPTIEPTPAVDPGPSIGPSAAPTAVAPSPTAAPRPASGSGGLSTPVLLVAVLFAVLLAFAAAYFVPRWLRAQRGDPPDPDDANGEG